jgi:DNA-binding GntR family transcriptional regulator
MLRNAILSRELREGTIITLDAISAQLGVSITPVREAFQILQRDGLIKQLPNRYMEVRGVTPKTIRDQYETRAVLEGAAAALVCRNGADTGDIAAAHSGALAAAVRGDFSGYSAFNRAFHMAIWTAAGNVKMEALLSELWNGLPPAHMAHRGHTVSAVEYARIAIGEHEKITAALQARDAELAQKLMIAHIIRGMETILTRFDETGGA